MKRVWRTKQATQQKLATMAKNIANHFGNETSCCIDLTCWEYKTYFMISIIPGLDETNITQVEFKTWSACLDYYFKLIDKRRNNV